jgi:hypothetical protein
MTLASAAERINEHPIFQTMKAWVLGGPEELTLVDKPVPEPGLAEALVRIDAVRCALPTLRSSGTAFLPSTPSRWS